MSEEIRIFYDSLAEDYHLIFADWNLSIRRQASALNAILVKELRTSSSLRILDCACGIGTQAIGLTELGYTLVGSDLSEASILRARREAKSRSLKVEFHCSDMTSLASIVEADFDGILALDNALPHLSSSQLHQALDVISSKLRPRGLFMASTRDYDALIQQRPTMQEPMFHGEPGHQRIVHQVWGWTSESEYTLHLFITVQDGGTWTTRHYVSRYRCLLRQELSNASASAGFTEIQWRMPAESGFYQPLVTARRL
jgi:glycine/sarcosine N-methyltransferase